MDESNRDSDDDAAIFVSLHPSLRRFAAAVRPADLDADDLVQEALTRTLRRGTLAELDEPLAYLRRVVLNLAANHRRSFVRRAAIDAGTPRPAVGAEDSYATDLAELLDVPPDQRAVLYLSVVEGWTHDEIAALLGITADSSRARRSRALRRLRLLHTDHLEVTP